MIFIARIHGETNVAPLTVEKGRVADWSPYVPRCMTHLQATPDLQETLEQP